MVILLFIDHTQCNELGLKYFKINSLFCSLLEAPNNLGALGCSLASLVLNPSLAAGYVTQ